MRTICFISVVLVLILQGFLSVDGATKQNDVREYYNEVSETRRSLSTICDECKMVVSEFRSVVNDTRKWNRLKMVLKLMCDYLGGQQGQECRGIVDNLDFFIHQLQPFFDNPDLFCREIHLCHQTKMSVFGLIAMKTTKVLLRRSDELSNPNDILCDECVFVASELNNAFRRMDIQQQLKKEIENTCRIFYSAEHMCDEYVEQYFPYFLQFLQASLGNPQRFCSQLELCSANSAIQLLWSNASDIRQSILVFSAPPSTPVFTKNGHDAVCLACRYGFKSFVTKLDNKSNAIAARLSSIACGIIPEQLRDDCDDFASIYASTILRMTLRKLNPDQICVRLGMCTDDAIQDFDALPESVRNSTLCDACHAFSDFVVTELEDTETQRKIEQMIKQNICPILPGDLSNQCMDAADTYVPKMMNRLANYVKSPKFCRYMGMCRLV